MYSGEWSCSICSKILDLSQEILIDDDFLDLLKFLVEQIDINALRNTPICTNCSNTIQTACDFKLAYQTFNKSTKEKDHFQTPDMCYACGDILKHFTAISFSIIKKNSEDVLHYLTEKLDFQILQKIQMCYSCQESVLKLQNVIKLLSSHDRSKKSGEILSSCIEIKKEDEQQFPHHDFICKNEKLDIKMEPDNNEYEEHFQINSGKILTSEIISETITDDNTLDNKICKLYDCIHCEYKTDSKLQLLIHKVKYQQPDKDQFSCEVCQIRVKTRYSLRRHYLKHSTDHVLDKLEIYSCPNCPFKSIRKQSLLTHMSIHPNQKLVKCYFCEFQTEDKKAFGEHLISLHQDNKNVKKSAVDKGEVYQCASCSYSSQRKADLKRHLVVHEDPSNMKMFKCTICNFQTKTKNSLATHIFLHKNIRAFECHLCGFKGKSGYVLRRHFLIHQNEGFKCDICDFKTRYDYALRKHKELHKNPEEMTMYYCKSCEYVTHRPEYLNKHERCHKKDEEVEMFKCSFCDYQTRHKLYMRTHVKEQHKRIKSEEYKCEMCDYVAKRSDHLRGHMLVHKSIDEIEAFICDICGYKTKQKRYLKSHILNHMRKKHVKGGVKKKLSKNKKGRKKKLE